MMSEIYMNMGGAFIDLDITANRRKFQDQTVRQQFWGNWGNLQAHHQLTCHPQQRLVVVLRTSEQIGFWWRMFEVGALTSVVDNIVRPNAMKKIKITHLKPEEKNKFIYVHVKVAAITKAKKN